MEMSDGTFSLFPEAMTMGKLHKEIGQLIVQSAEDPEKSNSQVIKVKLPVFLMLLHKGGNGLSS